MALRQSQVLRELREFQSVYKKLKTVVNDINDLTSKVGGVGDKGHRDDGSDDEEAEEEPCVKEKREDCSFIKPLRLLLELSGFPNLLCMYKILVSLAVTSCSAERSISRVRIIKNRLLDDWFSALMVLASENDILDKIPISSIIDRFAHCSKPLHKLLMPC